MVFRLQIEAVLHKELQARSVASNCSDVNRTAAALAGDKAGRCSVD